MRHGNSFKIGQMPFRCMQPVPVQGGLAGLPNLSVPPPFGEVEPPVLLLCCALSFPVPSATHIEKFKWAPTFPGASFLLHPPPHSSCGLGIPSYPHCQGLPFLPCVCGLLHCCCGWLLLVAFFVGGHGPAISGLGICQLLFLCTMLQGGCQSRVLGRLHWRLRCWNRWL